MDGSVLAIKEHYSKPNTKMVDKVPTKYDRVIVLIRDPKHAFLAEFNREKADKSSHVGVVDDKTFKEYWPKYFTPGRLGWWKSMGLYFKNEYKPHQVIFVSYESLQANLTATLTDIMHFLGHSYPSDIARCVEKSEEGGFHRPKHERQLAFLTKQQNETLQKAKEEVYNKLGLEILTP